MKTGWTLTSSAVRVSVLRATAALTLLIALAGGCASSKNKTRIVAVSTDDVPVAVLTQFELDHPGATLLSAKKETRPNGDLGYVLHYNDADGNPGNAAYEHDAGAPAGP
jgi:hypothetical protein